MYIEQKSRGQPRSAAIFGISSKTQIENELPMARTLRGLSRFGAALDADAKKAVATERTAVIIFLDNFIFYSCSH
jgi:hypothetical protein